MNTYSLSKMVLVGLFLLFNLSCARLEYGDAPDNASTGYPPPFAQTGQFPTLEASNGARVQRISEATLGPGASLENDADDPNDPDGEPNLNPSNTDADDGLVGLTIVLVSIPPPATLQVSVNGGTGGDFFMNVLIDLNLDGMWGGATPSGEVEWVVQNHPVAIASGGATTVSLPPFAFANGFRLPDGAWMRVALTQEQITTADWDGSGEFQAGEIEDHVIELPELNGKKVAIPRISCPAVVNFAGQARMRFTCHITNLGPAGDVGYELTRINGGVFVVGPPIHPNPGMIIGMPPGPPPPGLARTFTAVRGGPLPSKWRYRAWGKDPPTIVTPIGVIIGYQDSMGEIEFVDQEEEPIQ